jgi:hypothetical protein
MADVPLAYFITFRCYGTWLHGDERGSVDRRHNQYGTPYLAESTTWHSYSSWKLKFPSVNLSSEQRKSIEYAIRETCLFRNWKLHGLNVRINHVHSLVTAYSARNGISLSFALESGLEDSVPPERVLNALKANATRQLRADGYWPYERTPWVSGGSKRYIWTAFGLEQAKEYVLNGQGGPMPEFDKRPRGR